MRCWVTWRALRQIIEPAMARLRQDGIDDPAAYQALNADIARYTELRAQAQRVQHYLIIHREAMGFWNHDDVFRCYPDPSRPHSAAANPYPRASRASLSCLRAWWTMARAASSLVPSPVMYTTSRTSRPKPLGSALR